MFGLGFQELIIVGVVAILLFGKNLPQMAGKFGAMYREFRKGLDDLKSQVDFTESYNSAPSKPRQTARRTDYDDYDEVSAPKFEPPPAAPEQSEAG